MAKAKSNIVQEALEILGLSPQEAMAEIAMLSLKMGKDEEFSQSDRMAFLKMSLQANSELLQYIAPKQKSIEMTGSMEHVAYVVATEPEDDPEAWLSKHAPQ